MLQWIILRQSAPLLRRQRLVLPSRRGLLVAVSRGGGLRWASTAAPIHHRDGGSFKTLNPAESITPPNLDSIPKRNKLQRADAWLALLEPVLPRPLQRQHDVQARATLTPRGIFGVLSAAEDLLGTSDPDVLSYIAREKGRWNVAVWLIKHLVEAFAPSFARPEISADLLCGWKSDTPLEELTREPVDAERPDFLRHIPSDEARNASLRASSGSYERDIRVHEKNLTHQVLGMIWRSLGNMTMSCADGEIQPEVLEIIALLHHEGLMPSSIYDLKPSQDPTAIQQSPLLNLLSSRILTSLSDAAWRAHQKLVVEEAKNLGERYASSRPEIPGNSYRVWVTGLKPEVWLELVLWACLHGGWIAEGMGILSSLHNARKQQWKPLSWRSLVSTQPSSTRDWEMVEYLFNNRPPSSMDLEEPVVPYSVSRTVSSEIVNAFIDASVSVTRISNTDHGVSFSQTIRFISRMHSFLGRSSLSLGAGSWDAIVLRLFDLQGAAAYRPAIFDSVIRLSPPMGQEITSTNVRSLPNYVLDGTAAVFGLFHRALYYRIKDADVEGALRLFASLQERADENKKKSVADFLQQRQVFAETEDRSSAVQFTANYGSIDYPAFYVQIPPTILGPFLELVTDAKAYEFAKWLLYSEEIDGPIIPQHMYSDPSLTPALIRFAAEAGDKALLSRLIQVRASGAAKDEPTLPRKVLQSFLNSQINLKRWDAALKILQHMKDNYDTSFNVVTLCHLLRVSLQQARPTEAGDESAEQNLARARSIFRQLVRGHYERPGGRPDWVQEQMDNLLLMLASLGGEWTKFSINTQPVTGYRVFNLSSKAFNLVLEGVVDAYGSHAGRRLIGVFWSHQVRTAQRTESESDRRATQPPFSSFGRTLPANIRRQRTMIFFPGGPRQKVLMYGGLRPDLMTIRIVLRKAIEELNQASDDANTAPVSDSLYTPGSRDGADEGADELDDQNDPEIDVSPAGMVVWGARCLKRLGMAVEDIAEELKQNLPGSKLDQVLEKSPGLLTTSQASDNQGHESPEDGTDAEIQSEYVPLSASDR